ncbi:hypothetical protein C8F04DRAFT_1074442 [Mycena alexandri]|uniref:Secreted protein n=1 Tax=Mycena alexandri TaxID=1745969 RepID=A0AAD6TFI5_9AGAR|nr:hypothetical protein C8F04DRAFT_1074442 [Mycena alexandri]
MFAPSLILFFALCRPPRVVASLTGKLGTFASPHTGVKWRYWVEDGSASADIVRSDIREIAGVGASGFSLVSYQSYGGARPDTGNILLDPTQFAFGSAAFVDVAAVVVEAAIQNNLTIDLALGPNQGAGVPVFPDDVDMEGMNTELVFGSHFLTPGEAFSGPLPNPSVFPTISGLDGEIISMNITTMRLVSAVVAELVPGANSSAARVSLDWNSVQDLTSRVDKSFNVSFTAPNSTSVLLAYYSRRNGYPEARRGFNGSVLDKPGSWGSWVVDHFSAKGAQVSISFIEQNILAQDNIGAMAAKPGVGSYMWEDSMEFAAQLFWTDGFTQRFTERHGYEINKTLPVMHTLPVFALPGSVVGAPTQLFDFGNTVDWAKFTEDYRDTLTSLYADYMTAFRNWSHTIGFQYSNQPGYNFQLDCAAASAVADAPEIESLTFATVDMGLQLSGGVHLGNHAVFSSETGANFGAYDLTMNDLLNNAKSQYAAGVNVAVIHGFPYSGTYPETTWPGLTTFGYVFSEMHSPHMPAWDAYKGYMDFLKHTQYVLRSGTAKVDVAIYRKDYNLATSPPFQGDSLVNAGYSYEYVSPENLKLPGVSVANKRLAFGGPAFGGPAYKAFVLNHASNITVDASQRLLQYAQAGLPIVISGAVPSDIPGFEINGTQQAQVQGLMKQLTGLKNVLIVDGEAQVPGALASLGVLPAASVSAQSTTIFSVRRDVASASYFYLFNDNLSSPADNVTLFLRSDITGTPFFLDAWTGEVSPVALWTQNSGAISIPAVSLAPSQTALFAVSSANTFEGVRALSAHLVALQSPALAVADGNGNIEIRSPRDGHFAYTLSTGHTGSVQVSLGGETTRTLSGWVLSIVAWTPPQNLSTVKSVLVTQPLFNLTQGLVPWNSLPGQQNTSGVGTYNVTFDWDSHNNTVGVKLDFGSVFHTIKAFVNDVQIPTADPSFPVVDITKFVVTGTNALRVEAASTLLNAISAVPEVETLGTLRSQTAFPVANQEYGLVAPVQLVPYGRATISL